MQLSRLIPPIGARQKRMLDTMFHMCLGTDGTREIIIYHLSASYQSKEDR